MEVKAFVWTNYRSWRATTMELMRDHFGRDVLEELRRRPPRYFVADDLSWLDQAIRRVRRVRQPSCSDLLTERFLKHYRFVRGFHGCRPESTESYSQFGVLQSDPAKIEQEALRLFSPIERVQQAIDTGRAKREHYTEHNRGKVFFCLDPGELIDGAGHYVLYGSEYLHILSHSTGQGHLLKQRGRATIIECNVPLNDFPSEFLKELAAEVLKEICVRFCRPIERTRISGFGFYIRSDLAPQNIVRFHFPERARDPFSMQWSAAGQVQAPA